MQQRNAGSIKDVAMKWSVVLLEAADNPNRRIYLADKQKARSILNHSGVSQLAGIILPLRVTPAEYK